MIWLLRSGERVHPVCGQVVVATTLRSTPRRPVPSRKTRRVPSTEKQGRSLTGPAFCLS